MCTYMIYVFNGEGAVAWAMCEAHSTEVMRTASTYLAVAVLCIEA